MKDQSEVLAAIVFWAIVIVFTILLAANTHD